jgi:hypothetical protein
MATTSKLMFRGAASISSTTLYTTPSATTAVITEIIVTNTSGAGQTFTITLDGVAIATSVAISANSLDVIDIKQVLPATKVLAGLASATSVNFTVSGVEIA